MGNKRVPEVRFPGFTEDWEQRAFSDLVIRVSKSSNEDEFPRIEYEDIVSGQGQLNKDVFLKDSDKKGNEFEVGDTLFGYLRPYLQNWILADFKGIAVGDWWVLRPNEMDSKFIYTLVQSNNYQVIANLSTGTKMPRSDWKVVSKTMFAVPTDKFEQNKIGELFSKLDNLITLHQQELDTLKQTKQGFLQKMFPKNGESVPEIRFPGFTADWEQRKLNEYLTTSKIKNKDERFGKEEVLSVSGNSGIVNQIEFHGRSFAGVSVAPYGVVETGDVVYTKSPLKSNPFGIIKTNKGQAGIVSTLYAIYKPNDNVDSEFVERYFENDQRLNRYLKPLVNKGAKNDMKVSDDNALIGTVVFPVEVDEQQEITSFFNQLDNLITLHQRELETLNQTKKAFLQKMFV